VYRVFQIRHRWSRPRAIAILTSLLLAPTAAAARQSDFSLRLASKAAGKATALDLHIVYRNPANPSGKPLPIRHLVIHAPSGTRFNLAAARCTANDQQITLSGTGACPADSQVGAGTLTAITGFGPPIDPFRTDVAVFNTGHGVVEIVREHRTGVPLTEDRIQIRGSTLIGNPPATPGGPPDGQTAVRTIDWILPAASHYITTPPTCLRGVWTSRAAFTFADGSTQHVQSTTSCSVSGKAHHHHKKRGSGKGGEEQVNGPRAA
jgi:hypothetical protein